MIFLVVVVLTLGAAAAIKLYSIVRKVSLTREYKDAYSGRMTTGNTALGDVASGAVVVATLCAICMVISGLALTVVNNDHYVELQAASHEYTILLDQRNTLVAELEEQLDFLPGFEREIYREVNEARLLLRFPEIKANGTQMDRVRLVILLNQDLVQFQDRQLETLKAIDSNTRNPFAFTQHPWHPEWSDYFDTPRETFDRQYIGDGRS